MVFQDISNSFELNKLNQKKSIANLMDRFFSLLIDYLVISPFVLFLLYSTFSNGFNFWKQNPTAPENELFIVIFSIGYIIYFSLIQSLFVMLWGATPGQYFLKIRFEFHETADLIFLRTFLRQISFWFSFVLLGVPFLSVLTNKKRRTFYDRIGDVSIVSTKNEFEVYTYEIEYRYWQSFTVTLMVFMGFLFSAMIWKNYSKIVNRSASFAALQENKFFCAELEDVAQEQRLQVAVALNFAGQLSDTCLDKEADFVLWRQKVSDYSLAYFAKSLTTDEVEKEKKYLIESCAEQNTDDFASLTLGCKMAFSFQTGQTEKLYTDLKEDNFLSDAMKYELGLILDKVGDRNKNFARIEKHNSLKLIKKYQIIEILNHNLNPAVDRAPASSEPDSNEKLINLIETL